MSHPRAASAVAFACASSFALLAHAAPDIVDDPRPRREVLEEIPILAYTYSAAGVSAKSIGAQGYGLALAAQKQDAVGGGGALIFASPVDRVTLLGDASSDVYGRFAPSFAGMIRFLGKSGGRGFSMAGLVKYKVEGFSTGPEGEFESEVEGGVLASFSRDGWHIDANAIGGIGLTEEGEVDIEGRLRLGRDLDRYMRVGIDAQIRGRAHGEVALVGDRTWDFSSGAQLLAGFNHFFGAITVGPATTNVALGVGVAGVVTLGATTL